MSRSSFRLIATCAGLHSLDLECNALASIESLEPLWNLPVLAELRLRGNLLALSSYRRACRANLPELQSLDGTRLLEVDATPAGESESWPAGHLRSRQLSLISLILSPILQIPVRSFTPTTRRCLASQRSLIRRWKALLQLCPTTYRRASGSYAVASGRRVRVQWNVQD